MESQLDDKSNSVLLEELLLGEKGFLISLRLGEGIRYEVVDEIMNLLDQICIEYSFSDTIPKRLAGLFTDFYPAALSSMGLYDKNVEIEIENITDKMQDKIRMILYSNRISNDEV